ncbi:MAG: hypothetical protein ACYC9J_14660 [Sulfuricaulis sp.]
MSSLISGIRRYYLRQKPVAASELAAMATCEQRLVLEHKHGKRVTTEQKEAIERGDEIHRLQDADVSNVLTFQPVIRALRIGITIGLPLSVLGEILLNVPDVEGMFPRILGALLAAPGLLYSIATGSSVFSTTLATLMYFILQVLFYTVVAFFFVVLFQPKSKTS